MARYGAETFRALKSREHDGQGLLEYALILVLIAMACAGALGIFGTTVSDFIDSVGIP